MKSNLSIWAHPLSISHSFLNLLLGLLQILIVSCPRTPECFVCLFFQFKTSNFCLLLQVASQCFQTSPKFYSQWSSKSVLFMNFEILSLRILGTFFSKISNSPLYHIGKLKTSIICQERAIVQRNGLKFRIRIRHKGLLFVFSLARMLSRKVFFCCCLLSFTL